MAIKVNVMYFKNYCKISILNLKKVLKAYEDPEKKDILLLKLSQLHSL